MGDAARSLDEHPAAALGAEETTMGEAAKERESRCREPMRVDGAARALGFPTTDAFRKWCHRHRIQFYELDDAGEDDRVKMVDMSEIRGRLVPAKEPGGLPRGVGAPRKAPPDEDEVDHAVNDALTRRRPR